MPPPPIEPGGVLARDWVGCLIRGFKAYMKARAQSPPVPPTAPGYMQLVIML